MRWLNSARIIAIFSVVLLHVSSRVIIWSDLGSYSWWYANLYDSVVRWCVPVFIMISGALLLDPRKEESLDVFYRKRGSRVLIPLIFWSAFYLVWDFARSYLKGEPKSVHDLAISFISGKPYFHMWFLFMLLGLYFVTPFIRKVVSHSSNRELWVLSIILLGVSCLSSYFSGRYDLVNDSIFLVWFIPYIPYFIIGYLLMSENLISTFWWGVGFIISFLLTAVWYFHCAKEYGNIAGLYPYNYTSITVMIMSISAFQLLKKVNLSFLSDSQLKSIASLTLGVYLIHPILLDVSNAVGLKPVSFLPLVSIPVATIVIFMLSLAGAFVCSKIPFLRRTI